MSLKLLKEELVQYKDKKFSLALSVVHPNYILKECFLRDMYYMEFSHYGHNGIRIVTRGKIPSELIKAARLWLDNNLCLTLQQFVDKMLPQPRSTQGNTNE